MRYEKRIKLLKLLKEKGPITCEDAKHLYNHRSNFYGAISTLIENGQVERTAHDNRLNQYRLTDKGHELI